MKGQTKGASPDAFDAVRALKPYKGGNDTLWGLDQLNNIDKHRLLIAVGSVYRSFNVGAHIRSIMREAFSDMFGGHPFPKLDLYVRPADRLCPLKAGDELFIDAPDADPNKDLELRFSIALSEPQVAESEPILETLHQMVDLVDNLIPAFRPLL